MSSWTISGDVLEIADGENRRTVSAENIYQYFIVSNFKNSNQFPPKSKITRKLNFSRFPADLRIEIFDNSGRIFINLQAHSQQGKTFPISTNALDAGHVLHEDTWYPFFSHSIEEIKLLLCKLNLDSESSELKNLADILFLRKMAQEQNIVVDSTTGNEFVVNLIGDAKQDKQPKGINVSLYPYQIEGWNWLRFIVREGLGGLLGDEMGLGKTLQIICVLRDLDSGKHVSSALVIAPSSLLENWVREIRKFCGNVNLLKHQGPHRTGNFREFEKYEIVVTSYDVVVRDLSIFLMVDWKVVVLDEAQYIKNPEAIRTKSIKLLNRQSSLAVTGTPVENKLRDLWSIMDFILPNYLGSLENFESLYKNNPESASKLEPFVTPLIIRRRVKEVASDLPDRIEFSEHLELDQREAEMYEHVRKLVREIYTKSAKMTELNFLRQFCAHPNILNINDHSWQISEFTKIQRLKEILQEIFVLSGKTLIFTSFIKMADIIKKEIEFTMNVWCATLDGRVQSDKRLRLVDDFSNQEGAAALILNPRAGGTGLNITAANHVIHYNLEWNPAIVDQASARAYRHGQTQPVVIRKLIFLNTLEEVIEDRLRRKQQISDEAIVGVEQLGDETADLMAALEKSPLQIQK